MTAFQKRLGMIFCLLTVMIAVIDNSIVSAAVVPIVRDLDPVHGVELLPWLVTAFSLAATAVLPLYGKLCDVFGAKPIYLTAVGLFLVGSTLCGAAQNMAELIAFRALQGMGAGGLMSVTLVVLAHLMPPERRGAGGNTGGVFAGSAMAIGPLVGGLLADHAGWRWIFYVNVPLGVVVLVGSALVLRLPAGDRAHRIDFLGAGLAAAFAVALLLVGDWAGKTYAWSSPQVVTVAVLAVLLLALFGWREMVAAEPILPLSFLREPTMRTALAVQGLTGVAMLGSIIYLMVYLQVARGIAATSASAFLVPMALGLILSGLALGRLTGAGRSPKVFVVTGTATAAAAAAALTTLGPATNLWFIRADLLVFGLGFGQLVGVLILLVQQVAPPRLLGTATTAIRFVQNLGSALGVAAFGAILSRTGDHPTPAQFTHGIDIVFGAAAAVLVASVALAVTLRPAAAVKEEPQPVLA
jgi:EmrB/QacA subfamily drug resistance transporter